MSIVTHAMNEHPVTDVLVGVGIAVVGFVRIVRIGETIRVTSDRLDFALQKFGYRSARRKPRPSGRGGCQDSPLRALVAKLSQLLHSMRPIASIAVAIVSQ
ncbi:hypothetical protein C8039_09665 [Halogeometricum sp. wsp3]|nr:hypothetical protein C8039_09665 [Halogeometricum sp. wsp3]